ncbi:MAG: methyltransferase domain-containing protein [Actinobacteria bacterium]|nr:MAG: methyltransferase domain-containing protein [Actinomycetota bacterium]
MEASSPTSARSSARVPSPRIRRSTRTRRRSMSGPDRQRALEQYRRRARGYDRLAPVTLRLRRRAVERLLLGQGQTVLDVACSTGLTFGLIEDQIGPDGHLIGIDLSPEMLSQARERVAANGWRNVTLIESAIEDASIPEVAGAAVFVLTHDVMRSPEALGNVLAHVRPGGRISAAGGKRAPAWALPANLYLRYAMRRYTTTMEGFDRPWRILEGLVPDLAVEQLLLGGAYVAWGTTARDGA